jgi:hypothetical protein
MKIGNKRKRRLTEFTIREYGINGVLLTILFLLGLFLSWKLSWFAALLYLVFWAASYAVLYAVTCRNCTNYGKSCPVPFEGSCVQRFFGRGEKFGFMAGLGAVSAYFLRVCIPYAAIFLMGSMFDFILYTGLFAGFFYVLLYHTGCPNCVNVRCPFNPDFGT